jgi:hypothetical protein
MMAEQLESFEFAGRGRPFGSKYDQYLDGGIYRLVAGEDCPTKLEHARSLLYTLASQRGLKIRTQAVDGALVIQAYEPEREAA